MDDKSITQAVQNWISGFIVELNLCPFAKRELVKDRIRFVATPSTTKEALLTALHTELETLEHDHAIETTVLIHAKVLQDFDDYNEFLDIADRLLIEMNLEGIYQIASFHPEYQFSGTQKDDPENYTNRSPYPMLHLLREESLEKAIADFGNVDQIPVRNIELMNRLGQHKLRNMLADVQTASKPQ